MSRTGFRILAVFGALFIFLALFLGMQRLSVGDVSCGSAFGAGMSVSAERLYGERIVDQCQSNTSERQAIAAGAGVIGLLGLVGGLVGIKRQESVAT